MFGRDPLECHEEKCEECEVTISWLGLLCPESLCRDGIEESTYLCKKACLPNRMEADLNVKTCQNQKEVAQVKSEGSVDGVLNVVLLAV